MHTSNIVSIILSTAFLLTCDRNHSLPLNLIGILRKSFCPYVLPHISRSASHLAGWCNVNMQQCLCWQYGSAGSSQAHNTVPSNFEIRLRHTHNEKPHRFFSFALIWNTQHDFKIMAQMHTTNKTVVPEGTMHYLMWSLSHGLMGKQT